MANISKIIGAAIANIAKFNGHTLVAGDKVMGAEVPASGILRGYYIGGFTASTQTNVDAMDPSAETASAITALASGMLGGIGVGSNVAAVYSMSGWSGSGYPTSVLKWATSDDTRSTISGTVSLGVNRGYGMTDRNGTGWKNGGQNGSDQSNAEKIVFSTEVISDVAGADLTVSNSAGASAFGDSSAGYMHGGASANDMRQKLTWSTSTTSALSAGTTLFNAAGFSDDGAAQYLHRGTLGDGDDVKKMVVATETDSTLTNVFVAGNNLGGGFGDGTNGWFMQGTNGPESRCEKFTVSSETMATVAGAAASLAARVDNANACSSGL